MSIWSKIKSYVDKAHAYVEAHWDHFMISIGVSIAITIISNVIIHYMALILRILGFPVHLIDLLIGKA